MNIGPLTATELAVLLMASLPWLVGITVAIVGLVLLRRLVHASERIARGSEGKRREG